MRSYLARSQCALFIIPLIFFFNSCAPSLSEMTMELIENGKNDEAIAMARRNLSLTPNDPQLFKCLGIALYNKKSYADAAVALEKVYTLDPEDDQSVYYLAASYEGISDFQRAIVNYRRYNELSLFGDYTEIVDARIKLLFGRQMQAEAKKAIQTEAQLNIAKVPANTIAVLYFENKGKQREMDPLQKGLADMMITDLSKVKAVKVVERVRLQKLVEELKFSESGLVDEKNAPRVGKLLGAAQLVKGSFFDLTAQKLRIDALVARTRTGQMVGMAGISGNTEEFFRLEKELVFKVIDEMKIKLSDEEREAINTIPTENYFAFLQYSRGLDFEDKGQYAQAAEAYGSAVEADPNFSQAKSNLNTVQKTQQITSSPSATTAGASAVPQAVPPPPSSSTIKETITSVGERAATTSVNVNAGFTPGPTAQTPPATITAPLPEPPKPPQ